MPTKFSYLFVGTICFLLGILVQQWLPASGTSAPVVANLNVASQLRSDVANAGDWKITSYTTTNTPATSNNSFNFNNGSYANMKASAPVAESGMFDSATSGLGSAASTVGNFALENSTAIGTGLGAAAGGLLGGSGGNNGKAVLGMAVGGLAGNIMGQGVGKIASAGGVGAALSSFASDGASGMLGKVGSFLGDSVTSLTNNIIDNPGASLGTALGAVAGFQLGGDGAKAVMGAIAGGALGNIAGQVIGDVTHAAADKAVEIYKSFDTEVSDIEEFSLETPEEGGSPLDEALEKSKATLLKQAGGCEPTDLKCLANAGADFAKSEDGKALSDQLGAAAGSMQSMINDNAGQLSGATGGALNSLSSGVSNASQSLQNAAPTNNDWINDIHPIQVK